MGFYKNINNELQHAPNFVYAPTYTLTKEDIIKEVDGWKWFDTETDANIYFSIAEQIWTKDRLIKLSELNEDEKLTVLNAEDLSSETVDGKLAVFKIEI